MVECTICHTKVDEYVIITDSKNGKPENESMCLCGKCQLLYATGILDKCSQLDVNAAIINVKENNPTGKFKMYGTTINFKYPDCFITYGFAKICKKINYPYCKS
jgi:hypothetical protein